MLRPAHPGNRPFYSAMTLAERGGESQSNKWPAGGVNGREVREWFFRPVRGLAFYVRTYPQACAWG